MLQWSDPFSVGLELLAEDAQGWEALAPEVQADIVQRLRRSTHRAAAQVAELRAVVRRHTQQPAVVDDAEVPPAPMQLRAPRRDNRVG